MVGQVRQGRVEQPRLRLGPGGEGPALGVGPALGGQVTADRGVGDRGPVEGPEQGHAVVDPDRLARLEAAEADLGPGIAFGQHPGQELAEKVGVILGEEVILHGDPPGGFPVVDLHHPPGRGVDVGGQPVERGDPDELARVLDQEGELALFFLGPLAVGDVEDDAGEGQRAAVGGVLDATAGLDHPGRPVGLEDPELDVISAGDGDRVADRLLDPGAVVGVDRLEVGGRRRPGQLLRGERVEAGQGRVGDDPVARQVPRPGADRPGREGRFEAGPGVVEVRLVPVALQGDGRRPG